MARNGDERLELSLERIEAKLDRQGERLDGLEARLDGVESGLGRQIAQLDHKVDLVRAELRARIDLLRVELHDDVQTMLKVELGGRKTLADAEIDRLRGEIDEINRRLVEVERR
jgi:tetrahydromethanopterin S-methyltransferase subunit G